MKTTFTIQITGNNESIITQAYLTDRGVLRAWDSDIIPKDHAFESYYPVEYYSITKVQ